MPQMQEAKNLKLAPSGDVSAYHVHSRKNHSVQESTVQILDKEEAKLPEADEFKQKNEMDVDNDLDPFDKRMMTIFQRDKPFIIKGPQMLRQDLQRTNCSLFLNAIGDNETELFRAG